MKHEVINGDCLEVLKTLPDASVDSICTDPPYGLSFMGKKWDYDVPTQEVWEECLRVLKPGGHLLSFFGTRTYHRGVVRIEDAGFEIRDQIGWAYGSGFPKSLDVSKAMDKAAGVEREVLQIIPRPNSFDDNGEGGGGYKAQEVKITEPATDAAKRLHGWGTALKPAWEPIVVARRPLIGTVAENVLAHGTGAINVDGCRVCTGGENPKGSGNGSKSSIYSQVQGSNGNGGNVTPESGRWPANLCHDGSEEVLGCFPETKSGTRNGLKNARVSFGESGTFKEKERETSFFREGDSGSAARFFYCAKASKKDRDAGCDALAVRSAGEVTGGREEGSAGLNSPRAGAGRTSGARNHHPTVKPTDLMRWLVRLVTPPNGTVLDPFCGSGSTGKAAKMEGFSFIGIEREEEYANIAKSRIDAVKIDTIESVL